MMFLTMEYIKAHSRLDDVREQSADAELIEIYANAAEETVLNYIDRSVEELYDLYGKIPASVINAALLVTDDAYQHRSLSRTSMDKVDYGTFDRLLKPYMKL